MTGPPPLPPLVCLAGIDWTSLWQRSQTFMSSFAERGMRVAFVEQLDAGRAVAAKDWRRIAARARSLMRRRHRIERGVHVVTPTSLPFRAGLLNAWLLRRLAARLERLGFRRPVVWHYPYGGPNSTALERLLEPELVVYDCVTRVRGYPYATPQMIEAEEALARRADLVLTDAKILWEEKRALNRHCVQLPPGVDFAAFAHRAAWEEPESLRALPHPRLGFFGGINERLDQGALGRFAASHPGWAVVLIGPVMTDVRRLRSLPNVFFYPQVPHVQLGAWLQALEVIAIPYHANEFTRGIIPAKLFEALATGKPVVAMGLPELQPYAGVVDLCEPAGFGPAVEAAVRLDSETRRSARLAEARANAWSTRIDQAWQLLRETLDAKRRTSDVSRKAW